MKPKVTQESSALIAIRTEMEAGGDSAAAFKNNGLGLTLAEIPRAIEIFHEHDADTPAPLLRLLGRASENGNASPTVKPSSRAHLVSLADVQPEKVTWVWKGRIPRGKIIVNDGDPGLGKTTMMLDIGARVTTGAPMPDGQPGVSGGVVILTAEDGLGDVVRPRLDAAGADVTRVRALVAIRDGDKERFPTIGDLEAIREAIDDVDAVMVIIDPLVAYLGMRVNAHRDQDVRSALSPLAALGEQTGAAITCIRHLNKTSGRNPLYRGGGSIGIIGAARSGLLVAVDPDDDRRRILAVTKSNLAAPSPSLAFHLEADMHDRLRVVWDGGSPLTAKQLLAEPETDEDRSAIDDASAFLREVLASGPVLSRDVKRQARDAGVAERTMWRAKTQLGVQTRKVGDKWEWSLSFDGTHGTHGTDGRNVAAVGESGNSAISAISASIGDSAQLTGKRANNCPMWDTPVAEDVSICGSCAAAERGWA